MNFRLVVAGISLGFVGYLLLNQEEPSSHESHQVELKATTRKPTVWPKRALDWLKAESKSRLELTLVKEAAQLGAVDVNPKATEQRLRLMADAFTSADIEVLKSVVMNPSRDRDQRFLACYLLDLAKSSEARSALEALVQLPLPPTRNDREYSEEIILRSQALDGLMRRLTPEEAKDFVRRFLSETSDALLARQARYWLSQKS